MNRPTTWWQPKRAAGWAKRAGASQREGEGAVGAAPGDLGDGSVSTVDLTVVVPFYNPGARFPRNLERLVDTLESTNASYEIVAVSDGSTDGSAEVVEEVTSRRAMGDRVRRIVLETNRGKGEAVRVGLANGRGRYLGFIDADGDLSPDVLVPFITIIRLYQPDIILGSKRHPMSKVSYPPLRRLYSWGFQQLCRALFQLNLRDTQTGVKLVRRDVLAAVLPRMVEKRFAFDLELFVVARHLGHESFFEAPVTINERFMSTVDVRAVARTLVDTLAIFWRLRARRFYDRAPGRPPGTARRPLQARPGRGPDAGHREEAPEAPPQPKEGLASAGPTGPAGDQSAGSR